MWPPVEMFLFALLVCVYAVDAGSVTQKAVKSSTEEPADSYDYLRCWRCDYDDADQCVKNFDFTKHKHEACDGKCLKAYEKTEARTKVEIEKAQKTPTIRKCVSQRELEALQLMGINTKNGCQNMRTGTRKHKTYCFCENDLCNGEIRIGFVNMFLTICSLLSIVVILFD